MVHPFLMLAAAQSWIPYGYIGLLTGSFLSALFIPLGADFLYINLLISGFNPWICLLTATTGGWLGGLVIYGIGSAGNTQRIRKLLRINEQQIVKQKARIKKYGSWLALLTWIPVIGDLSNVALGFYHTARTRTFIFMYIGRMCRFFLWTILYLTYSTGFVRFMDKIV